MNTPAHVMAGAFVAQTMMVCRDRYPQRWAAVACGAAAFALGVASHLFLDSLPHNNWIVYLNWFPGVPFHWLLCEALCALPVVIVGAYAGRDHPAILLLGVLGGMYPDFEKVAYVDFHLPRRLVMFPAHSLQLSSHHCDLAFWKCVVLETGLILLMVSATVVIARCRLKMRPV